MLKYLQAWTRFYGYNCTESKPLQSLKSRRAQRQKHNLTRVFYATVNTRTLAEHLWLGNVFRKSQFLNVFRANTFDLKDEDKSESVKDFTNTAQTQIL